MYKKIYCSKVWKDIYWNHWNKACVCWSVYVFLGNAGLKREKKPFLNNCFTFCLGKIWSFWSIIWKIYINFTSVVWKNNINLNTVSGFWLNTYLWASMGQNRLGALSLMHINVDIDIDAKSVLKIFCKSRNMVTEIGDLCL